MSLEGRRAFANAALVVERERFNVGIRDWGLSAREIEVRLHIEALRAD